VTPFVVLTIVAVAVLLVAEFRSSATLRWIAKPTASAGFLLAAWAGGAFETDYGSRVFTALVLGAIGDVLLIPKHRAAFLLGLVSFLLGHLAFAWAFAARGMELVPFLVASAALAVPAVAALRWLDPHVPSGMRVPVQAYVLVITVMVACAAGALTAPRGAAVLTGAVMFFVSDLAVARERFVSNTPWNKAWGLPLYYGAQLLLAWTASTASPS
jgi:uncharacterized membrane protein YhhN